MDICFGNYLPFYSKKKKRRGGGERRICRTEVLNIVKLTDFGEKTFFFFKLILALTLKNRKTSSLFKTCIKEQLRSIGFFF